MIAPPLPPLPRWIGHRGAAARAPENTLASLRRAADDGAHWVEFDLRLTADEVPVLLHDEDLDRTTDGDGPVAHRRWSELSTLDAGAWFGAEYRGEPLPSLAQALACCAERGLGANLELKARRGAEAALVAAVTRALRDAHVPLLLSAFAPEALECAARQLPGVARGLLCEGAPPAAAERAHALGCASLHAGAPALDAQSARALRARGATLLAYTVNDCVRARALYELGVAAVFTDDPRAFAAAF